MPIKIPDTLPALDVLQNENIFVMTECRAAVQDIRPLRIALLNLMPTKIITETQFMRLIGNTPLQVDVELLHMKTHESLNTAKEHLTKFYKTFADVRNEYFDGLIITGAPVENLEFEEVDYWEELTQIMEWSKRNVFSTLHICWGAQAGLYYHYGIAKQLLPQKMFGVFWHDVKLKNTMLLRGFDDRFLAPHSRHTGIRSADIAAVPALEVLASSEQAGVNIVKTQDGRQVFVTGHFEYDPLTLQGEYERDLSKGLPINIPENYYPENDPQKSPVVLWRSHANLFFANWLNYYVYQETPYNLEALND